MAVKYHHSTTEPPLPKSWRIARSADNFDIKVEIYCPNGHKMVVPADMGFHQARIPLNIAHGCIMCDFKDIVYLVSDPSPLIKSDQLFPRPEPKDGFSYPNPFIDFINSIKEYCRYLARRL